MIPQSYSPVVISVDHDNYFIIFNNGDYSYGKILNYKMQIQYYIECWESSRRVAHAQQVIVS